MYQEGELIIGIGNEEKLLIISYQLEKARWSSGQDGGLSRRKHEFDSRTGHHYFFGKGVVKAEKMWYTMKELTG